MAYRIESDITLFFDVRGEKVWVNDTIAYAVRDGSCGVAQRVGKVTRIQRVETQYGLPWVRVQVEVDGRKRSIGPNLVVKL